MHALVSSLSKSGYLDNSWVFINAPEFRHQTVGDILKGVTDVVDVITHKSQGKVILYHGTSKARWDQGIKTKGLQPSSPTGFDDALQHIYAVSEQVEGYSKLNVYLTNSIPEAEMYATRASIIDKSEGCVLSVEILDFSRFVIDEDVAGWVIVDSNGVARPWDGKGFPKGTRSMQHFSDPTWRKGPDAALIEAAFQAEAVHRLKEMKVVAYRGGIPPSSLKIIELFKPVRMKHDPSTSEFEQAMEKTRGSLKFLAASVASRYLQG